MKKNLFPFALLLLYVSAIAQPFQNEKLSYLNEDWKPTREKKAAFVRQVAQVNDTIWETNLYRMNGPRINSLRSRDAEGTVPNGSYCTYRADGWMDTLGFFYNAKREGRWLVFAGLRVVYQLDYHEGSLITTEDSMQLNREQESDSSAGKSTTVEVESTYPGGTQGWLNFLNRTLHYPDDAVSNKLMGDVDIEFVVNIAGTVPQTKLWVRRSVAFSLDKESLRVICQSGNWAPAIRNGVKVKSYKVQPIKFRLSRP